MLAVCPKCNSTFDNYSKWGSKKFCSRSCANSRIQTEENNRLRRDKLLGRASPLKGKPGKLHTDETRSKISQSMKRAMTEEIREKIRQANTGKVVSPETKLKLSKLAIANNLGGHTSKRKLNFIKNDGTTVYLQSSYEILFATILEKLKIGWERPSPLIWVDENGVSHKYYPDFKIGNIYIDTKNDYLAIIDLPKINAVKEQNNIDLRIVTKELITEQYIASLV